MKKILTLLTTFSFLGSGIVVVACTDTVGIK
ncbi:Uncharacterised protein [Mycoplasma putrefaciens]|nr:Uncharacterised protein [Mycoplasma putrefaciens]